MQKTRLGKHGNNGLNVPARARRTRGPVWSPERPFIMPRSFAHAAGIEPHNPDVQHSKPNGRLSFHQPRSSQWLFQSPKRSSQRRPDSLNADLVDSTTKWLTRKPPSSWPLSELCHAARALDRRSIKARLTTENLGVCAISSSVVTHRGTSISRQISIDS